MGKSITESIPITRRTPERLFALSKTLVAAIVRRSKARAVTHVAMKTPPHYRRSLVNELFMRQNESNRVRGIVEFCNH